MVQALQTETAPAPSPAAGAAPRAEVRRPVVWTIAGTDSGGGAGVQADTRMFDAFGVHGACAVAAITAQHSRAVERVEPVAPAVLEAQLATLAQDMPPAAIKTGLLGSVENLRVVADWVRRLRAQRPAAPVALIVDPVLGATTGASFADEALRRAYREELLPLASLATPNTGEAALLAGPLVRREPVALAAAWRRFGSRAVVVTGGDVDASELARAAWAQDYVDSDRVRGWFGLTRVGTPHNHGTGCVFSAAAAAAFAHGFVAADAVVLAKMATAEALRHAYAAGDGAGPVAPRAGFARFIANLPRMASAPGAFASHAFKPLRAQPLGLYPIVDSAEWVQRVLKAGARIVQLRMKFDAPDVLVREIRESIVLAREAGALLVVNDHWQLALELRAPAVHLGQEDLDEAGDHGLAALREAGLHLGVSTHSYWEVCRARAVQASYVACGPIHETRLKAMPWKPQGMGNVAYWSRLLSGTPVVAIGGMDAPAAREAMRAGAAAVAVVSAITRASEPEAAIEALQDAVADGTREMRYLRLAGEVPAWARPTL
jgi:hydroxymethylpyrimidine kinase/phosphomethylpyrimidine kinase/thiamine-phosphate diphosphorylase